MIGRQVGGYVVTRRLGEGGMGAVYLAEHRSLPQKRVIKVLLEDTVRAHPEIVERFLLEARAASQLDHPNIIHIFDVAEFSDGRPYILMPFLEGQDLEVYCHQVGSALGHPGRLPIDAAWRILAQVAAALTAVHAAGIIHRDLKAGNVFIVTEAKGPRAVLIDFGLAKVADAQLAGAVRSLPSVALGTPSHMAPEQIRGKPIDARADIYAFGVMAYAVVTGRLPYVSPVITDLFALKLLGPPADPRTLVPELPEAWAQCLLACLNPDPTLRPASMRDVALMLMAGTPGGAEVAREVELVVPAGAADRTVRVPTVNAEQTEELSVSALQPMNSTPMAGSVASSPELRPPRARRVAVISVLVLGATAVAVVVFLASRSGDRSRDPAALPEARAVAQERQRQEHHADDGELAVMAPDAQVAPPLASVDAGLPVTAGEDAGAAAASPPPDPLPAPVSAAPPAGRPHHRPRAPAAAASPAATGSGTLIITAQPWAEVTIDGKAYGTTTIKTPLPAGPHKVRLEKPDGTTEAVTVTIEHDKTTRVTRDWSK